MSAQNFNIRVYGILKDEQNRVLVSDELIRGMYITKFPGGGLEIGEGTRDCLRREFLEEMNLKVEVGEHLYTTDYYQPSAFNSAHQIISIYYTVKPLEPITVPIRQKPFDFDQKQMEVYEQTKETETFRWVEMEQFSSDSVTLPIDKIVADLVKKKYADHLLIKAPLESRNVMLKSLEPCDADALWTIASNKSLWEFTSTKINNREDFDRYLANAFDEKQRGITWPFLIIEKQSGRIIGSTRFANYSHENKRVEIGYTFYHPDFQGTGVNREIKYLILQYAFEVLQLNRVELKTSHTNLRSQHAIQKIGAKPEGVLRHHIVNDDGSLRDTHYFSILREEWQEIKGLLFTT